ncbi:MAG: hypothetical protein DRJ40_05980 [Thermoprotei archaeon]|nr:MAG: hypothetical protein DRJ40_05980 [Thermoprotei archaeon]
MVSRSRIPIDFNKVLVSIRGTGSFTPEHKTPFRHDFTLGTKKAIIALLALYGPLTLREIADTLNLTPPTVYKHLKVLKEHGVVRELVTQLSSFRVEKKYDLAIPFITSDEVKMIELELEEEISKFVEMTQNVYDHIKEKAKVLLPRLRCYGRGGIRLEDLEFVVEHQVFSILGYRLLGVKYESTIPWWRAYVVIGGVEGL